MKNWIRVLLYVLLALLVVAISVMMYKRYKTPVPEIEPTTETTDSLFVDTTMAALNALTAEDSLILGMTGELPNQVGPADHDNGSIDYSQPVKNGDQSKHENMSPKAQTVSNKTNVSVANTTAAEVKTSVSKTENKTSKTENKKVTNKTSAATTEKSTKSNANVAKSSKTGKFYVISGSFIVPSHADKQVSKLKKLGFSSSEKKVFGNAEYYSAIVGRYDTRSDAEKTLKLVRSKGEKAFLKVE